MAEPEGSNVSYETVEAIRARHRKELKALEGSCRRLVKQANKNKAKVTEAEVTMAQMLKKAKERHRHELEAAESVSALRRDAAEMGHDDETGNHEGEGKEEITKGVSAMSVEDVEKEKRDHRRAKAQRKRNKQREKVIERDERIEREKREGGPDPRITEMQAINGQIAPRGFRVSDIKADGHCLYRAVAEQLNLTRRRPGLTEESYAVVREEAARELRSSPGNYLPFLDGVEEGQDFDRYCSNVAQSAEWGGQVELQALCTILEAPIEVFSATSPPLLLGEKFDGVPLRLAYHEHYYALGAHYNSVVPA